MRSDAASDSAWAASPAIFPGRISPGEQLFMTAVVVKIRRNPRNLRAASFGAFLRVSQAPAKQLPDRASKRWAGQFAASRSIAKTNALKRSQTSRQLRSLKKSHGAANS